LGLSLSSTAVSDLIDITKAILSNMKCQGFLKLCGGDWDRYRDQIYYLLHCSNYVKIDQTVALNICSFLYVKYTSINKGKNTTSIQENIHSGQMISQAPY
jgi:hypothetical protein